MSTTATREAARPAGTNDLGDLVRMGAAAVAEQAGERGGWVWSRRETRTEPLATSFAGSLAADDHEVWVGTFDDVVVGYAAAHVEELRDGSMLAVVDDLFVEGDAREVGVGEALIASVTGWARSRSCVGIDGWALPGNRETKNFFESFGFTARGIVVHHRLDPE